MHRVGLGGVTIFEGAINTPQVVPHRLIYMTPEWKQAFNYCGDHGAGLRDGSGHCQLAGMERDRRTVGSRSARHEEDGVDARRALKAASRSRASCRIRRRSTELFRTFEAAGQRAPGRDTVTTPPQFYADVAVIAYKIPDGDKTQAELNPQVTSSGGTANVAALSDGDVNTVALDLPASAAGKRCVGAVRLRPSADHPGRDAGEPE